MSTAFRQNFDRVKSEQQEQQYYTETYSNANQQQSTRTPPSFFCAGGQSPQYTDHENGYEDDDESQEYSLSEFSHIHLADGTLESDNPQHQWHQINGGQQNASGNGPTSFAEHHNSQQQRIQEAFAAHNAGALNSPSHLPVSSAIKDQDQLDISNVGTSSNRKRALSFNNDKAYSYNFNVITCESCKAFFRRNANKEKEIRCPFNEQCDINIVSRRFCQRCRLQKCFRVGMKKEWIMSEEARLEKKQRIQDNRDRRMAERQQGSGSSDEMTSTNVTATAIANPMENILMNVTEPPSLQNHLEIQSNIVPPSIVPIPGSIIPMNGPPTNLIAPVIGEDSLAAHAAQVQFHQNNLAQPREPQAQPTATTTVQNGGGDGSMADNAESVPTLNQPLAAPTITTTTLCSPLFPTESATQSAMNNFGHASANTTMITTNEPTQCDRIFDLGQPQTHANPLMAVAAAAAANQQLANHQPQMVSAAAVHAHLQAAAVQAQLQEHQHQLLAAQQAQLQQAAAHQLLHNASQSQQTIQQQQQQHAVAAAAAHQIVAHQQQQAVVAAQIQQQQIAAQIAASCHIPQPTQAQPTAMVQPAPQQSTMGQSTVVDFVTGTQPPVPSTTALHQSIVTANGLVSSGTGQPVMSTMQSNTLSQPQSMLHQTFMDTAANIIPPQAQHSTINVMSTMQQPAAPAPQSTLISQQILEAAAAAQPAPSSASQELVAIPKDVLMKLVEHKIENEQQQQHQKMEESKPAKCQCHCQCGRYPNEMLIVDKVMTDLLENSSKQFDEQRRTACASACSSNSNFGRMDTCSNHTPPSFYHSSAAGTPIQQNKPFDMELKINPADYCQLTLSDQDSLNELVQVNAIWNSEPCDIQCGVTENGLRRLVRMISSVPVFRGLDRHDQTLLLKHGCESYFVLRGTSSFNDSKISYLLQNRVSENIVNFYKDFPVEWRSNETIILLLGMILLFDAQVPELHNQISVTVERMKYESIAKRVLYTLCSQDIQRAASAFTDLISRLDQLKSIATLCQTENFEPIVQQMFEPPPPPPATTAMDSIINMSTM
ncbi:zinc finger, c4 type (two domains) domain-containing protein [Ditylenchus destructor]|nr:zinc finger, c4 type (two domains) domain-containing protein [Ditylenchus destructor]